jgi:DNA mismatch repair protein MutL
MLVQLGIEIGRTEEQTVEIRTIPTTFPQLDIKKFIQRICVDFPTQTELLKLLVMCQSFNAFQLNQDEKIELMSYLQQQLLTSSSMPWCMRLDTEKCRELVNV